MDTYQSKFSTNSTSTILLGVVGLNAVSSNYKVNWEHERISLKNFDNCAKDIEFMQNLSSISLCAKCEKKKMQYCYCRYNKVPCSYTNLTTILSIENRLSALNLVSEVEDGLAMVEMNDNAAWEPYLNKNGICIWRREERANRFAYKVYANFNDITANDLFQVQTDISFRREWDETAEKLEIIEEDPAKGANSHLIYWEMKWPRFFSNRDYVYSRRYVKDENHNVYIICNRSTTDDRYPVLKKKIRVENYWSFMVIKPYDNFNQPGVHFVLTYFDDPGVVLPDKLKSLVADKQMPEFVKNMYEATKRYSRKRDLKIKILHSLQNVKKRNVPYTQNLVHSNS